MKKLFVSIGIIFMVSAIMFTVIGQSPPVCCGWNPDANDGDGGCVGYCSEPNYQCVLVGDEECRCQPDIPADEFKTPSFAIAALLLSPAFAYLVIRRKN